jgi:hypothetical protein
MKLEFPRQICEKFSSVKIHENPSTGSSVVPWGRTDRQTDMPKLIVAFRKFCELALKFHIFSAVYIRVLYGCQNNQLLFPYMTDFRGRSGVCLLHGTNWILEDESG